MDTTRPGCQLLGPATATLAVTMRLAIVCKLWRRAAGQAQVLQSPKCHVWLPGTLEPRFLSPLLAQLITGQRSLSLCCPLLAARQMPAFLEVARPDELVVSGTLGDSTAVGATLASCASLLRLACCGELVPSAVPPNLQALSLDVHYKASAQASLLVQSLAALPRLAELRLDYTACEDVPQQLPHLPALRYFTVTFSVCPAEQLQGSLRALQVAAAQGVSVSLEVHFIEVSRNRMQALDRELLWAMVAGVPLLTRLQLSAQDFEQVQTEVSAKERQLLQAVRCKELVLIGDDLGMDLTFAGQLWLTVSATTVLWRHQHFHRDCSTLHWSCLAARPGVAVFSAQGKAGLLITGYPGSLPAFAAPWALVLQDPSKATLTGVPLGLATPGPGGCLAWRNSAATDAVIARAFDQLRFRF